MASRQRRAFERTLKVCEALTERAEAAVASLGTEPGARWALSREERATLSDMVKLLGTVLDFEKKHFGGERAAEPGAALDLDAARAEIARRLDRLAAAGGA